MKEQNIDPDLLAYILSLLSIPNNDSPGKQNIRTACEVIRFMDEMPGGFFIYRADDQEEIIYANKALLRICQCETLREFRELTGNSFRGFVYPPDLDQVEQSIKEQIADNQYDLDYVEYRIQRKDGKIRWIEDYGHFIRTDTVGNIFYVFVSDATQKWESRQAAMEKQLQKEQELKSLIDQYHNEMKVINQEHLRRLEVIEGLSINYDSILYADLDLDKVLPYRLSNRTTLQFENSADARSFSWYTADYARVWVHPEDKETVAQQTTADYIREMLSKQKTYYINFKVMKDSMTQYLQLRIVNVGSSEHISQIVMGYRRVDDEVRRQIEQKQLLEEALNNANLAITAKNTFLSNMSHDMRTPLNAIFGFTALAKDKLHDPDSLAYYLNKINASSEQLLDLIDKVLEIAWTDSDDNRTAETECSLKDILENIKNAFLPLAREKEISITLDSSGLIHSDIQSDQDKLERLLSYLAHNAIKYTQNGGMVTVSATELNTLPNDHAVYQFVVEDNGIGISPAFLSRIYEPFEREKNTTFSGVIGTGLGLTIVKKLVNVMGGTIDVQSEVGSGSRFTVTLRLKTQNHPIPVSMSIEDTMDYLSSRKILLVEDNEINLEIETAILEGLGFVIDTAENGSIAVEMMQKAAPNEYALILMDIQMPVMNGRQATRAIRSLKNKQLAHIPIIALSADAFESDKRKSIESGMDAHLPKPIDVPVLLETITKTIQMHQYMYGDFVI
ncbi:MAG: response regulator [Eubacterium sp.]|nr:response regulator [Eubacterium sp.]